MPATMVEGTLKQIMLASYFSCMYTDSRNFIQHVYDMRNETYVDGRGRAKSVDSCTVAG